MALPKQTLLSLILFVVFNGPLLTFAYSPKEGNVTALFGPYFYKTNFNKSNSGAKSPISGSPGIIFNGDVNDKGGLEIALFQMKKTFFRESGPYSIAEETSLIHITMGYRRWLSPLTSASLTFYSAYAMGDPKITHSDFTPGQEIDTSAHDLTEYGFDFSVQRELWSHDRYAIIIDGRYSWSVTNKPTEKSDHYGFIIGLKYLIQEKFEKKNR